MSDFLVFALVYYVSAVIGSSLNFNIFNQTHHYFIVKFLVFAVCLFAVRIILKIYKSLWRYANYWNFTKLVIADVVSCVLAGIIGAIFSYVDLGFQPLVVITVINTLCTLSMRFLYEGIYAYKHKRVDEKSNEKNNSLNKINVAIVGAGNIGVSLSEVLNRNPKAHYRPYCFIDTDANKAGSIVNGIPVYQDDDLIIDKIKKMPIQEIVIAIADLDSEVKTRLYKKFKQTNCKVKLYDYPIVETNKKATIREFSIEDLLFRDSLAIKSDKTREFYSDKVVMVTGGGGSIGSEICRQVAKQKPKKLVIVDIYENNAYEIEQELIRKYGDSLNLKVYIASVRDEKRLDIIFNEVKPEIVVHAAAHKHVPLMENSATEAIKNNVLGTYNTANMAEKYNVERFLLISTDKAVNPTNVMGASKRLCEMVIQCRKDSKTRFMAVRFGNVLGSNGSVIPLFKKQIAGGGPITITDKRIIRYFMTIPEAASLVLEAGSMAKNGELFVLDMGKPVRILDLAENMIWLSGLTPYEDIDIKEIGLRPGEKLYEELLMKNEELDKTENSMIFIERDKGCSRLEMEDKLSILKKAVVMGDNDSIREAIKQTVPTYISPETANKKLDDIIKEEKM